MGTTSSQRLRTPRWAELRPVLIAVAFVASLVFGVIGYQDAEPDLDLATALFKSVQLFVLEGGVVDGDTPWALEVARYLAPAVVGYAAIRGVMVLARDQLNIWRTRLFTHGHVLIVGDSAATATVADRMLHADRSVVVVTPRLGLLTGHRERGATVLEGDPRDPLIAARGRPDHADDIVVAFDIDADALRALAACEEVIGTTKGPAIHVALTEPRLWEELHSVGLAEATRSRSVEFFLMADREARLLLRGVTASVLLIEAEGAILERLMIAAGRAAVLDQRILRVILGPRAADGRANLLSTSPWLSDAVELADSSDPPADRPFAAVIAGIGDAAGIALGARLARAYPSSHVRVAVAEEAVEQALMQTRLGAPNLDLVPAGALALGTVLLSDSATEILARAKHEDYVARETARGMTPAANPSMTEWDELPPSLQLSNRRYAQSVARKLDAIGATLTPLTSSAVSADLDLPASVLEDLAQGEHERWRGDLVADGWSLTTGAKDPQRKLHPLLVPWPDLDESEREKDRDGFRALPQLVARAGYQLAISDERTAR